MSRSTLVGLVVLVLLVAGGYWARRIEAPDGRYLPNTGGCVAGSRAEGAELPDITRGGCYVDAQDVRVFVSVTPQPPVAFSAFTIRVTAEALNPGIAEPPVWPRMPSLPIDGSRISFAMSMPMGEHRYSLLKSDEGWYEASVVLPLCPSGDRRWIATIEGDVANRPRTARVALQLAPPKS